MKFKKSYLFMISLISILLCISAVSATSDIDNEVISDNSGSDITSTTNEITDNADNNNQKLATSDNDKKGEITSTDNNIISDGDDLSDTPETPEKINTTTESKDVELKYNDSVKLNVAVKNNNNSKTITTNLTKDNFTVFKGSESEENKVNFTYKDSVITLNDKLDSGLYSFLIKYLGNEIYNPSKTTVNVTVFQNIIKTDTTVNVNNHTLDVSIPVKIETYNGTVINNTVKDDFNLVLNYTSSTEPITGFDYVNGTLKFIIDNVQKLNNATVTIYYKKYDESNKTKPVDVKLNPYVDLNIIPIGATAIYQSQKDEFGEFKFKVVDAYDNTTPVTNMSITISLPGNVYFATPTSGGASVSSSKTFTSDSEGYIIIKTNGISSNLVEALSGNIILDAGKYNLTFKNSDKSSALNMVQEVTVDKAKVNIILNNHVGYVGEDIKLYYQVVNAQTGEPINLAQLRTQFDGLTVNNSNYYNLTTNASGQYFRNLGHRLPANTYSFVVSSVDSNIIADSITRTMTVNKIPAAIEAKDVTFQYNTGLPLTFTVKDKTTGKAAANVRVTISIYEGSKHKDYTTTTNANGQVKVTFLTQYSLGKHKIVLGVSDSNYTADTITRYATVKKANAKFKASKVKTYYRSGKVFTVKLTTTKGKAIFNGKLILRVYVSKTKYYKVTGSTGLKGLVSLKLNRLAPGTYKVVVIGNDKGYSAKKVNSQIKITKMPVKLKAYKFKAKSGKTFKVKVINKKTKKVVSAVKLKVKISKGKKSKTYTIKSNKKGIASLKIKQKPGKYKVVVKPIKYYSAKTVKSTITVKK